MDHSTDRREARKRPVGLGEMFSLPAVKDLMKVHAKFLSILLVVELLIVLWAVLKPEILPRTGIRPHSTSVLYIQLAGRHLHHSNMPIRPTMSALQCAWGERDPCPHLKPVHRFPIGAHTLPLVWF